MAGVRVRVLVVEDAVRIALLKRGLCGDGYAVDVASTGTDAIWQAGEFIYDVMLLDVMLPARTGTRCAGSAKPAAGHR